MTARPRHTSEDGLAITELIGLLPLVMLAWLGVLQVGVAAATAVAAQQAATVGARASSMGETDAAHEAVQALPTWLRSEARASSNGDRLSVTVSAPRLIPGLPSGVLEMTASTSMPEGSG